MKRSHLAFLAFALPGCLEASVVTCDDGRLCPSDKVCDEAHDGCVEPGQLESCAGKPAGARCTYPGLRDGACYEGVCLPAGCGNGVRDDDELCDDGNRVHGDGCAADCLSNETCGNGVVDVTVGESCEPRSASDPWCRATCVTVQCGDGTVDRDTFEACDDGAANSNQTDAACRPNCQPRRCGDGVLDDGELCDDGNLANGDGCSHDCASLEACGNGYRDLDRDEECDDANLLSHDGCSSACRIEKPRWSFVTSQEVYASAGCATYDVARGRIVYYCADGLGVVNVAELGRDRWRSVPSEGERPASQSGHALVWDGRSTLLFGGAPSTTSTRALDETWAWNGASWRELHPVHSPSGRTAAALAYDAARRRVVLFGGMRGDDPLDDTWEWDGTDWYPIAVTDGPKGGAVPMTYDPVRGEVLLFDGAFMWRYRAERWTRDAVERKAPPMTHGSYSIAYDPGHERVVLVTSDGLTSTYDGKAWSDLPTLGLTGRPIVVYSVHQQRMFQLGNNDQIALLDEDDVWQMIDAAFVAPPPQYWATLVHEPMSASTLLYGGATADTANTWRWDGFGWYEERALPGVRQAHVMSHEGPAGRVILFGGTDAARTFMLGTWAWSRAAGWTPVDTLSEPPPREFAVMAYDGASDRILLHGGVDADDVRGDVWTFQNDAWTPSSADPSPPGVHFHAMTYDGARERLVLFGSGDPATWEWDGSAWFADPNDSLPGRYYHGLVYDPQRRRIVLYGGYYFGPVGWEWDGETWEAMPDAPNPKPGLQDQNLFVYDAARARAVTLNTHGVGESVLWEFAYSALGEPDEACKFGFDTDGDGKVGCDDPDCWPFCTPLCPPGATCDESLPHCGDATCNQYLETCRLCPGDCSCDVVCGDYVCDAGETAASCPGDCS